jgi:hypothetical protein
MSGRANGNRLELGSVRESGCAEVAAEGCACGLEASESKGKLCGGGVLHRCFFLVVVGRGKGRRGEGKAHLIRAHLSLHFSDV